MPEREGARSGSIFGKLPKFVSARFRLLFSSLVWSIERLETSPAIILSLEAYLDKDRQAISGILVIHHAGDPGYISTSRRSRLSAPLFFSAPTRYAIMPPERRSERQRRRKIPLACEPCRERKSRCDGAKPICSTCQRRSLPLHHCIYTLDNARTASNEEWVAKSDLTIWF
jgi:hypothetical protein